ncbi:MAG: hypothetical protein U0992_10790 [Planctomycetaceae bacterium]
MPASMAATHDGYPPGSLVDVQIRNDGTIDGITSNGYKFPLAHLRDRIVSESGRAGRTR